MLFLCDIFWSILSKYVIQRLIWKSNIISKNLPVDSVVLDWAWRNNSVLNRMMASSSMICMMRSCPMTMVRIVRSMVGTMGTMVVSMVSSMVVATRTIGEDDSREEEQKVV